MDSKQRKKYRKNRKGQTLIELLVAMAIISISLVASVSLAIYIIKQGTETKERVQATLLAQESIEYLRVQRDSNWLQNKNPWTRDIGPTLLPLRTEGQVEDQLETDLDEKYPLTPFPRFERYVDLTYSILSPNVIQYKITIKWKDSSGKHQIEAVSQLTNWGH